MQVDWALGIGVVVTAVSAALGGLLVLWLLSRQDGGRVGSIFTDEADGAVFLFDGDVLIDATPGARALLAASAGRGGPWVTLVGYLVPLFGDLDAHLEKMAVEGGVTLTARHGEPLILQAELRGGLTRITLTDPEQNRQAQGHDPVARRAMLDELDLLRQTLARAPVLIWREEPEGDVIWANAAYLMRAGDQLSPGQDLSWPLPRLFERTASAQGVAGQRQRLTLAGGAAAWFDLVSFAENAGRLVFALPADAAVQAEGALRDFMQTLTKTFAHLPIGLAIFDKSRQLQLFNPALLDLTALPVDFLSMRPSLLSVLDAMRDRSMIPEPKDYRDWRRQLVDLEKAAASGLYQETWSLPGGQTYRVIARPHPNGALALMIEDISTEMLRTRRYRADLELGQSVIDAMAEAVAVFSNAGQLVMSNTAYARLWGHDPAAAMSEGTVRTLCAHWRGLSAPSPIWAAVEDFVANPADREAFSAEARLLDGRLVDCHFAPLAGGATLATFRHAAQAESAKPRVATRTTRRSA